MTYEEKKVIADKWLINEVGLSWDDLGDINSLHDCETEEEVLNACKERLQDDGLDTTEEE